MAVQRVILFGEVLFDCFEGRSVAGGAPFNVAWHLRGLGEDPLLLSRIGADAEGKQLRELAEGWKLSTAGLQVDAQRETGRVLVTVREGQPVYDIKAEQAYDYIDETQAREVLKGIAGRLFYHGSLALRGEVSRATMRAMREMLDAEVFFDVNLRPPWVDQAVLEEALQHADWLKCNVDELETLAGFVGVAGAPREVAETLLAHHGLKGIVVTLGGEGAFVCDAVGNYAQVEPESGIQIVDTVGAGDAFCAVFLHGLLKGREVQPILEAAVRLASRVCGMEGATGRSVSLYDGIA